MITGLIKILKWPSINRQVQKQEKNMQKKHAPILKIFFHRFIPSALISLGTLFAVKYLVEHSYHSAGFAGDYGQVLYNRFSFYYLAAFIVSACIFVYSLALELNAEKLCKAICSGRYKLCTFSLAFAPFTDWSLIAESPAQDISVFFIYLLLSVTFIVCAIRDAFHGAKATNELIDLMSSSETVGEKEKGVSL